MTNSQGQDPRPSEHSTNPEPTEIVTSSPLVAEGASHKPQSKMRRNTVLIFTASVVAVVLMCCGVAGLFLTERDSDQVVDTAGATATTSASTPSTTLSSNAPAPTTEPAAPTTAAPAPTTAAPAATPRPRVIKGRGDDVVKIPPLSDLAVVAFTCSSCSSNTVLQSDGPEGLLVNEIGAYSGKRWIDLEESALTTQFEVQASGSWTLTIGTVALLATHAPSGKASGRGDDVVVLGGSATTAKITHSKGRSNFVVEAYSLDTGEGGLLVNEVGGYSGVRPLAAPALVQVTADGNWTISPA